MHHRQRSDADVYADTYFVRNILQEISDKIALPGTVGGGDVVYVCPKQCLRG